MGSFPTSKLASKRLDREIEIKRKTSKIASKGVKILGKLARLAGSFIGAICRFFNLDFAELFDGLVEAYFTIKEFDWNATDKAIEDQIKANNQSIATTAARLAGQNLGFSAVRLANFFLGKSAQAAQSIKIPVLSARIGLALAEEGNEEAANAVRNFIRSASGSIASNAFLSAVLFMRRRELMGMKSNTNESLPNGSIAQKIDQQVKKLPLDWQNPTKAFIDGFEDGIIDAGYVVAMEIDDFVLAQRYAQRLDDPIRTVEVEYVTEADAKG